MREVSRNTAHNGPEAAFTQRATIDVAAREISVFIGLIGGRTERKRSAFWIYSIPRSSWRKVYEYEGGISSEFATDTINSGGAGGGMGAGLGVDEAMLGAGGADGIDFDGELEGDEVPESGPLQALPAYSDDMSADEEMPIDPPANSWTAYTGQNVDASGTGAPAFATARSPHASTPIAGRSRADYGPGASSGMHPTEPQPRYATQLVFDDRKKVYYLHGGNPEDASDRSYRLDDFWRLTLLRPTPGEILRRAKFRVRRQRFLEMTRNLARMPNDSDDDFGASAPSAGVASVDVQPQPQPQLGLEALMYLQTEVGAVVDHSDESESRLFRRLMSHLLSAETSDWTARAPALDASADEALSPLRGEAASSVGGGAMGSSPLSTRIRARRRTTAGAPRASSGRATRPRPRRPRWAARCRRL